MSYNMDIEKKLRKAHPLLRKLFTEVARQADIQILDAVRDKAAQELAFKQGHTKVHFGKSAHNYLPAIALDVVPLPINWKNHKAFIALGKNIVMPTAARMKIPIRWGADWNMNGDLSDESFVDMPHYELHPWRTYAKESKLFEG